MKEKTIQVLVFHAGNTLTGHRNPASLLAYHTGVHCYFGCSELNIYNDRAEEVHYAFTAKGLPEVLPDGFSLKDVDFDWVKSRVSESFANRIFSEV